MRLLFVFVLAAVMAILSGILFTAQPAHAAPADATWSGQSINYDGKTYSGPIDSVATDSHKITPKSKLYVYTDPAPVGTVQVQRKAYFIYFAPGLDPGKESSASYVNYDFTPPDVYSKPSSVTKINITPQTSASNNTTSCAVDGIGYIICPVTNFLAKGMDWLFGILSSFLVVRPIESSQDTPLYKAWTVMQSFANVAFVIAFLVLIYSQITGGIMTNYGIKKLLPRLIVAAILVNISYWICAVAVDVSNILGYSIQDVFLGIRDQLVGPSGNGWHITSWQVITGAVLSGATVLGAGVIAGHGALAATGGSFASAIYLLLPALALVVLAIVVAVLILAARQAIITILIVLSPLAFVAFLLPNTEKMFNKWRELFTTMLVLFPMFSIVFGGAQLAGTAIIQNADSLLVVILGMIVQIAPVVITPLLIKLSGSLLGRIAGMVNNPKKGFVDRTRNWGKERSDLHKARALGTSANGRQFLRRGAQAKHTKHSREQQWKKAHETAAEAHVAGDTGYRNASHALSYASMNKEAADAITEKAFNDMRVGNVKVQVAETNLRVAKLDVDVSKAKAEVQWENMRTAVTPINVTPAYLAQNALRARALTQDTQIHARQLHEAQEIQKDEFAEALMHSDALRTVAGGIAGEGGAESSLAAAIATKRKQYGTNIAEKNELLKHFNPGSGGYQELALGNDYSVTRDDGTSYTFKGDDNFTREAAIDTQLRTGAFGDIQKIIEESAKTVVENGVARTGKTYDYRTSISDAIPQNNLAGKAVYFGSKSINDVSQGTFDLDKAAIFNIVEGKIKDEVLAKMDAGGIKKLFDDKLALKITDPVELSKFTANRKELQYSADRILANPTLSQGSSASARQVLETFRATP
ncbi:MAG: hypothetical protein ABIQ04_04485 [Candidatus Saccharimonadales bacterium]